MIKKRQASSTLYVVLKYIVCIILALLSIFPFYSMFVNATHSSAQVIANPISIIPSHFLSSNFELLNGKNFDAMTGFKNSFIVSTGATLCTVYFSSLTAYALITYQWKLRQPFFTFILAIMIIPAQITSIGFYQFVYKVHMINSFLPLILPAIAAPATVFFMRQYLQATLSIDIINSARIDGAREFNIFNRIVIPIMKPAIATQAIFAFVNNWNQLFIPAIILTDNKKHTMPIMVGLLNGDIYKTEYGSIYLGLSLTVLPLFIVYFLLSKYIIAGVALGGVKE